MLLTVSDLIALLRQSVNVQYKDDEVIDPLYLAMTDEDLLRYLKLGVTRVYPEVTDIEDLPDNCSEYALVLLAKIELYMALAVMQAGKVDLGADNNNYIKQSQRFDHYMNLAKQAKDLYDSYLDNEGASGGGGVQTYEMLHTRYSHTKRYYENQLVPKVSLKITGVTSESFHLSWSVHNISKFGAYKVYMSKSPIIDMFKDGSSVPDKLSEGAKLIRSTCDKRNTYKSLEGLEPDTTYYVAVVALCRNGVWGYKETSVNTLPEVTDVDEVDEDFTESEV